MVKSALIGHTGLIGDSLLGKQEFDLLYNSSNIQDIRNLEIDTVYCCAPSGNRLHVNQHPLQDLDNINAMISELSCTKIKKMILVSTVDTQHCPDTPYGKNRLKLENFVKTFTDHHIIRLSTLIDHKIKKNVLYDLKHRQFLDFINLDQCMHWYLLSDLSSHIDIVVKNQIKEINLVSEPIYVSEIIDTFYKGFEFGNRQQSRPYNLTCYYSCLFSKIENYVYDKNEILDFMRTYLYD